MSHERTIGIEMDGKHYVIPTVINGKRLTADEAVEAFKRGDSSHMGVYSTQEEADAAARFRSQYVPSGLIDKAQRGFGGFSSPIAPKEKP